MKKNNFEKCSTSDVAFLSGPIIEKIYNEFYVPASSGIEILSLWFALHCCEERLRTELNTHEFNEEAMLRLKQNVRLVLKRI